LPYLERRMRAIVNNIAPVRYIPIKLLSRFWRGVFWSRLVKLRYRTDWPEPQLPSPQWVKIRPILGGICGSDMAMVTLGNPALPFGGVNDSGFGRYKGHFGLHSFSNIKSIMVDRQSSRIEAYWFPYSPKKFALLMQIFDTAFEKGPIGMLKTAWIGLKLELLSRKNRL